jgi:hypothetical protein
MKKMRHLDGMYFRVKRGDKHESICISDMTESEILDALKDRDTYFLKKVIVNLAKTISDIGEQFDLSGTGY